VYVNRSTGRPYSFGRRLLWFLLLLPVAQLLPVFFWLHSKELPWLKRAVARAGLSPEPPEPLLALDPLERYFNNKVTEHAGFIFEALVESIPQSVLQMVALVAAEETSALNV